MKLRAAAVALLIVSGLWIPGAHADNPGPIAHWDFSDGRGTVLRDKAGGHNGTIHNAAWVKVGGRSALEFKSTGSYVDCGVVPALNLGEEFTIAAWARVDASPYPNWNTNWVICGSEVLQESGALLRVDGAGGQVAFRTSSGGLYSATMTGPALENRVTNHVAIVRSQGVVKYFLNGRLEGTAAIGAPARATAPFTISDAMQSFDGQIFDLKIYGRGLSRAEVMAAFQKDAVAFHKDASWIGGISLKLSNRLAYGHVACVADFQGIAELPAGAYLSVGLFRVPGNEVVQSFPFRDVPDSGENEYKFDMAGQPDGRYEIRAELVQGGRRLQSRTVTFDVPYVPAPVPAPVEQGVGPLPSQPAVLPCQVSIADEGGLRLTAGGKMFRIDSFFSYPNGGDNGLLCDGAAKVQAEPSWRPSLKQQSAGVYLLNGEGGSYRIERRIEVKTHRVVIKDTFTNKLKEAVGVILAHKIRPEGGKWDEGFLSGYSHSRSGPAESLSYNPTLFLRAGDYGLGVIALDDVFILQSKGTFAPEEAQLLTDSFALDVGASWTLEWAIYPTASGDYYDFINTVRRDEGRNNVTLKGAFTTAGGIPKDELFDRWNIKYISAGGLSNPPDDRGISLEGIEFIEYPKIRAALRDVYDDVARRHPDVQRVFHIAHSLYATNKPEEKFPDSRVIGPDGKQGLIAPYSSYFSPQRVAEGWNWFAFYPTMTNSFGKAMLSSVDMMFDDMHASGGFMDGFSKPYGGDYAYDRWDGHTADIDPVKKTIQRKKGDLILLSQDAMIAFVRKVNARGGVVIVNNAIITRSIGRENIIVDKENQESPYVHLAQTPVSLGRYLTSELHAYREVLQKLSLGNLHFFYPGEGLWPLVNHVPSHDHVACQMYPIAVQEVHAGCVVGADRIVTMNSGVYGWQGDRDLHHVHFYDAGGWEVPHSFFTTSDKESVRSGLQLGRHEMAVIRKVPIAVSSAGPVNVRVERYDKKLISLFLNGKGEAALTVRDGEVHIVPDRRYRLVGIMERELRASRQGVLSFSVDLNGPAEVRLSAVDE